MFENFMPGLVLGAFFYGFIFIAVVNKAVVQLGVLNENIKRIAKALEKEQVL